VRGQRAPAYGPGDHSCQVQHAHAGQRTLGLQQAAGRSLADAGDLDERERGDGLALGMCGPLGGRAHHGGDQLGLSGRRLERLGAPFQQRRLHRLALVGALQKLEDAVAMVWEVGV
jgi:hypothetical protein